MKYLSTKKQVPVLQELSPTRIARWYICINKKKLFVYFETFGMCSSRPVGKFFGDLVHFWSFGVFFPFGYVVKIKIW
jgi:hypothetical protein